MRFFQALSQNTKINSNFHASVLNTRRTTLSKVNYPLSSSRNERVPAFNPVKFIQNKSALREFFQELDLYSASNYLADIFTEKLSNYANQSPDEFKNYFIGQSNLDHFCKRFIAFCFKDGMAIDKEKTLDSFKHHDKLSDQAVKHELIKLKPKTSLNLLGFGLGDGEYEKTLASFLLANQIATTVNIFGFDPYTSVKDSSINYINPTELSSGALPKFDVITARWVLHHVEMKYRWDEFIKSINYSNEGALVLIVEHGFLNKNVGFLNKRLYQLLNATFDIVANIGIRPEYFLSTYPNIGQNFYIHYLEPKDFIGITRHAALKFTHTLYDVGPGFPNQTICCLQAESSLPRPKL